MSNSYHHRHAYIQRHRHLWENTKYDLPENAENGAVIVETRPIPNIGAIIKNHLYHLGSGWGLTIIIDADHALHWEKELDGISGVKIVDQWQFAAEYNWRIMSVDRYNVLLTSTLFWTFIAARYKNKVLIFQHDSLLLRSGIDAFMDWDYVGAPWKFREKGGNGGLSLRNPLIMLKVIEQGFPYRSNNEDIYFSDHLEQAGGKLAPREICGQFSTETIFELGTLGQHAVEEWLNDDEVQQIYNQYESK